MTLMGGLLAFGAVAALHNGGGTAQSLVAAAIMLAMAVRILSLRGKAF
jgi:hypothetical protein